MAHNNIMELIKILVLISVCFIHVTEGYSCLPQHEQNKFCESDFVIRAEFLSREEIAVPSSIETTLQYTVKVKENFRGKYQKNTELTLVSPGPINPASLDISVANNPEFLIGGKDQAGTLSIDSCSWTALWSSVNDCIKARLGSIKGYDLYKNTCATCNGAKCSNCQVTLCFDEDNACIQEVNNNNDTCLLTYGDLSNNFICTRDSSGCGWRTCSLV